LKISVREAERLSLEQIRAFLEASEEVHFEGERREEIYGWISRTLQVHSYGQQSRRNRGLLRRYTEKLTGLSRAQVTRLIGRYLKSGEVEEANYSSAAVSAAVYAGRHRAAGGG
jgi:hypothetical protein